MRAKKRFPTFGSVGCRRSFNMKQKSSILLYSLHGSPAKPKSKIAKWVFLNFWVFLVYRYLSHPLLYPTMQLQHFFPSNASQKTYFNFLLRWFMGHIFCILGQLKWTESLEIHRKSMIYYFFEVYLSPRLLIRSRQTRYVKLSTPRAVHE